MQNKNVVLISIITLLIGIFIGYGMGYKAALDWGVGFASNFIKIDINEELIAWGLIAYKDRINSCYPPNIKNALISNNTGN